MNQKQDYQKLKQLYRQWFLIVLLPLFFVSACTTGQPTTPTTSHTHTYEHLPTIDHQHEKKSPVIAAGTPLPKLDTPLTTANTADVVQIARWGKGHISAIDWSSDGKFLAISSSSGVYIHDATTLADVHWLETGARVLASVFSPDGSTLAAALTDSTIQLWHIEEGVKHQVLEAHTNEVNSVAFSPDGNYLASGSNDMTVNLWKLPEGMLLQTLEGPAEWYQTGNYMWIGNVAFSSDSSTLAAETRKVVQGADSYSMVMLWLLPSGEMRRTMGGTSSPVFSPDNTMMAASSGGSIALWRLTDGKMQRIVANDALSKAVFSPDGQLLATCAKNYTVTLWNSSTGEKVRELAGPAGDMMVFSPDGQTLATATQNTLVLWDVASGSMQRMLVWDAAEGVSVSFSTDGTTIASGSYDGSIHLRRVRDGMVTHTLVGHTDRVTDIAFSPGGRMLASASWDRTIKLWDVTNGSLIRTLEGHTDAVSAIAFSPDSTKLVSGSCLYDGTVKVWDVANGKVIHTLTGHTDRISDVAFSPNGRLVASASWDKQVLVWLVKDGALLYRLQGHTDWVRSIAFSQKTQLLASGADDGTIQIWSVLDGTLVRTLQSNDWVSAIAFSPDGSLLATGSWLNTKLVHLWDVETGALLKSLQGHTSWITGIAFSPNGKIIASGSDDGTVRLWGKDYKNMADD
jgi:WD40 repeat protein